MCIGLRASLSSALGKAVGEVTNADMQGFSLQAASSRSQQVVKDCVAAVSETSASEAVKKDERSKCRSTVLQETLAVALCKPSSEVSDEEVNEHKKSGAAQLASETLSACMKGAGTDSTAQVACQQTARNAVAEVVGSNGESVITDLKFEQLKQSGAREQVFARAQACAEAESSCDLRSVIASSTGAASSTDSTPAAKTETKGIAKRAASSMVAQNLMACTGSKSSAGSTRTAADIMECSKATSDSSLSIMVDPKQFIDVATTAIASIAMSRMEACRESNKTVAVCTSQIEAMPVIAKMSALASTSQASNETSMPPMRMQDVLLRGRAEMLRSASDCSSAQKAACLQSSKDETVAAGGEQRAQRAEISFNAQMQAAETWAGCNNTDSTDLECETEAKAAFERNQGNPAEWSIQANLALAEGINSGTPTQVRRNPCVGFSLDCAHG